ncbi:putative CoA-transferase [Microlunatus phosphovorus NM-1]|uniref:Putative CoA-transferase n=1 Tax=Microlunatus phosphovorus (strain ATCC 700054 / DSM 10555 / JCM 9379 / NBRC 101784 / NCIMB 13414 / VKM Ac-1990 / NM-1) TaxID=1032480 RepID=F5XIJ2_MICPN|nr:CoA transferase [Microlunatus phosphovorus]BAK38230.1 putative CoA-transferase [Microlunatus phosphovorus NM-1]
MTTFDRAFKSFHEVRVGASNDHKVCVASRLAGGSDPLHCIIDSSDVVVENFSARVMRSLGLDYASLSSNHPGLIMLSMSGLGRSGPGSDFVAYGSLLQAYGGWLSELGMVLPNDSIVGERPRGIRPAWTDQSAGAAGALGILASLNHRGRHGSGVYLDLSMLESLMLSQAVGLADLADSSVDFGSRLNTSSRVAPHGCYQCTGDDEWVAIAAYDEVQWQALAHVIGRDDLSKELTDHTARQRSLALVDEAITAWTKPQSADQIVDRLIRIGVPCARSHSLWSLLEEPGFASRGLFAEAAPGFHVIGLPWRDAQLARGQMAMAPEVGEHTVEVLGEVLNLDTEEVARLAKLGVLE